MWKYLVFFLALFISNASFAQETQQLTDNSYYDGDPHIYNGKVVWNGGYKDYPNPIREIFLSENGSVKQLTFDGGVNLDPRVGSHYVTWKRFLEGKTNTSPEMSEVWCFDGKVNRKISLNSSENYYIQTAGKYIAWIGVNPDREKKIYCFNGEKTEELPINNSSGTIFLSEDGLLLMQYIPSTSNKIIFYDFKEYYLIAESSKDTIISRMWLSGRTILYNMHLQGDPPNTFKYFIYKNGQTTVLPELDTIGNIIYFDSLHIVWQDRRESLTNYKLNVWKNRQNYFISQYPFTNTQLHPELLKLRFAWHEFFSTVQVFYFDGKIIRNISIAGKNNLRPVISNSSVAWYAEHIGRSNEVTKSSEIHFLCGNEDTTCQPVKPIDENLQKVYYDYQNQLIKFELFGVINDKYNLVLYDLRGREILNQTFNLQFGLNNISISVFDLQQSIYLLRLTNLTNPDKSITKKLLITR